MLESATPSASPRLCPGHSTVATDDPREVLNGVAVLLSTVSDGLSFVDPIDGVTAVRRRPQHGRGLRCLRTKCDRLRAAASGVLPVRCAPLSSLRSTTGTGVPLRSKHRYQSTPDFPGKRCATGTSQPFGSYGFLTGTSDGGTTPFPRLVLLNRKSVAVRLSTRCHSVQDRVDRRTASFRGNLTPLLTEHFHPSSGIALSTETLSRASSPDQAANLKPFSR